MSKGARGRRNGLAIGTALLAALLARGAAASSLAGCYERVYDATHLARYKGQLVVRARLMVGTGNLPSDPGDPNPIIANAALEVWVRGEQVELPHGCRLLGARPRAGLQRLPLRRRSRCLQDEGRWRARLPDRLAGRCRLAPPRAET